MQIFITGASGFVGGGIAKALARSHALKAMSRSEQSDNRLLQIGAAPVRTRLGAVTPDHLAGCEAVIHCAGFVRQWGTREEFWTTNVQGTQQLVQASRLAGVGRFIYIGSEAVLFNGQHLHEIDETYPYAPRMAFLYPGSKAAAEQIVLTANAPGFETLSIRPRLVWGPGDQTILPVIKKMVEAGQFVWINGGQARTSTTHIANVAHAVSLALVHGRGGQAYFVTDDSTTTYRDFITALLQTQGLSPPDRSIPSWVARLLAFLVEGSWRVFGLKTDPPLTRLAAAMMSRECTIRIGKARRELHYEPIVTPEDGLRELRSHSSQAAA